MFVAGISFKTAPVALREQLAVTPSRLVETATRLKEQGGLSELALRFHLQPGGVVRRGRPGRGAGRFARLRSRARRVDVSPYVYVHTGEAAARHLFAVASGLDSMVLGETEITGQIKTAYEAARRRQADRPGPQLRLSARLSSGQSHPHPDANRARRHLRGQRGRPIGRENLRRRFSRTRRS